MSENQSWTLFSAFFAIAQGAAAGLLTYELVTGGATGGMWAALDGLVVAATLIHVALVGARVSWERS